MATNQEDILGLMHQTSLRLRGEQEETADLPPAPIGMAPELAEQLGFAPSDPAIDHPSYKRTDHDNGFLGSLGEGLVGGVLEPFRLIPAVDEYLKEHEDPDQVGVAENLGYGLGYMASFLIPATGALKAGAIGVKGVKMLKVAKAATSLGAEANLARAGAARIALGASATADIGLAGNLARGAGAGAILGAGMTPGSDADPKDVFKNAVMGAALGGVGDAAMYPLGRVVAATWKKSSFGGKLGDIFSRGDVVGTEEGALLGRASEWMETVAPKGTEQKIEIGTRIGQLEGGLARLGLDELQEGEVRILHSLTADGGDLRPALEGLEGMEVHHVKRKIGTEDVTDILITPEGEVGREALSWYKTTLKRDGTPWLPGQVLRDVRSGTDVKAIGLGKKPGFVKVQDGGKKGFREVKLDETIPLPMARWEAKISRTVPEADDLWRSFSGEFGEAAGGDWYDNVYGWLKQNAPDLTPAQKDNLVSVFARRSLNSLAKDDPALGRVLDNLVSTSAKQEGDVGIKQWAASNGYMTTATFNMRTGKHSVTLVDALPGSSTAGSRHHFDHADSAIEFLRNNPRNIPDLMPKGVNMPYNHLGFTSGAAIQELHSAATMGGVKWHVFDSGLAAKALPRAAYIRFAADNLAEHGLPIGAKLFKSFDDLSNGMKMSRLAQESWVNRLLKLRGGSGGVFRSGRGIRTTIRGDKQPLVMEMMSLPRKEWDSFAKKNGVFAKEVNVADGLKDMWGDLFTFLNKKKLIDIDADEYLTEYLPHLRKESAHNWEDSLRAKYAARGEKVSEQAIRYLRKAERGGHGFALDDDPFVVPLKMIRSAMAELHLNDKFVAMQRLIQDIPEASPQLVQLKESLKEYVSLSYGQNPEAYQMVRIAAGDFMSKAGIELPEGTLDRLVNTFASMNYGAFMAFRAGLALRNLTQPIFTTMALIQDPVVMAQAIGNSLKKATRDKWRDAGAVTVNSVAAPIEDAVFFTNLMNSFKQAGKRGKVASVGLEGLKLGERVGQFGLKLYTGADQWNRVLSAEAMRLKAQKAWNRYADPESKWYQNLSRFNEQSGLDVMGEAQAQIFHQKLSAGSGNPKEAIDWLGVQAANETQWIYQLGAGPAWMSHGVGRLMGMYGTWPAWYAAHMVRGMRAMKRNPKVGRRFFGWTGATVGALMGTSAATGINLNRWSPLTSFSWTGGPAFDWLKDYTDIAGGFRAGQPPTAGRAIGLSQFGLRDRGNSPSYLLQFDPRKGQGLDLEGPGGSGTVGGLIQMGRHILEPFTPGALFLNDIEDAIGADGARNVALEALGLPPIAGMAWPEYK